MRLSLCLAILYVALSAIACGRGEDDDPVAERPSAEASVVSLFTPTATPLMIPPGDYALLFVSGNSLYWVHDDGTNLELLHEGDPSRRTSYSPDGAWAASGCAADGTAALPHVNLCIEAVAGGGEARVVTAKDGAPGGFLQRAEWGSADFAWSADSRSVAFLVFHQAGPDAFGDGDLYVYDTEDGSTRLIDSEKFSSRRLWLRWSPDGRYIAAVRSPSVGGGDALQIIDVERATSAVATGPAARSIEQYVWAPDSSRVSFTWNDFSGTTRLFTVAADSTDLVESGEAWGGEIPAWSPDSKWVAAARVPGGTGFPQLFVMSADGTAERAIARGFFSSQLPAWSAANDVIAFVGSEEGAPSPDEVSPIGVYVTSPKGPRPDRRSGNQELVLNSFVVWSPDGESIFFTAEGGACMEGCPPGRLFVVAAFGSRAPVRAVGDVTVTQIVGWVAR